MDSVIINMLKKLVRSSVHEVWLTSMSWSEGNNAQNAKLTEVKKKTREKQFQGILARLRSVYLYLY